MSTKHCCNEQTLLTHLHTLRSILIKRPRVAGFALCPSSQDSHRTENARERRRRERAKNTRVRAHGARAISRHTRYMILYCLHNLFIIHWFSLIPLFHLLIVPFFSFVDIRQRSVIIQVHTQHLTISNTFKCTNSQMYSLFLSSDLILFHLILEVPLRFYHKYCCNDAVSHVHGPLTLVMVTWHADKQIQYFIFSSVLFFRFKIICFNLIFFII